MGRLRFDTRVKELPSRGSHCAFSYETEIVGVEAECVYEAGRAKVSGAHARKIVLRMNPHRKVGETFDTFDIQITGDEGTMELLAMKLTEAVERWRKASSKQRRGVSSAPKIG